MKKMNFKRFAAVILMSVLMMFLLTGCLDEEGYDDGSYSGSSSSSRDLASESDYPHGTADKLEGKIVIVSIFVNDNTTSWNFESQADQATVATLSKNMSLGMDWIVEQGKRYGKDIEFIYNWDNDAELFYALSLDCDFSTGESMKQEVKTMLDENFKEVSDKLLTKYGAENIIYALYLNEKSDTNMVCHAMSFIGTQYGYDMPYEPICLTNWVYGAEQGPATYAHEILHIFGAPDYYEVADPRANYGITDEFIKYCENSDMINEIMHASYDPYTNTIPKDRVTNDLSDLTAYYIGWIDECSLVDEYGLGTSQHQQ